MQISAYCNRSALLKYRFITKMLLVAAPSEARSHSTNSKLIVRAMKLMMILLTTAFMHVQAAGFSQKITFTGRNVLVEEIFDIISAQTGYTVFANKGLLKQTRRISIEANNMPLQEFLAVALKDQPLQFTIAANTVVLSRKAAIVNTAALEELEAFIPITGTVMDADGKPIVGASVTVKGSNTGTVTDANGRFSLNANLGETLVISYIGHDRQEVRVVQGRVYNLQMKRVDSQIDSFTLTVNTGYQRIRPEQSTGAVSQISTKEYESRISTNFLDGLVNRLPGLMINNNVNFTSTVPGASGPNSRPLFNIRGISTMSANQNPLIVIDGYPTELTIDMLDPNEIKSVTILKDAAAATIYGVRASNGVIIIERKQASEGKPQFAFRATLGVTPKEDYHRYRWADDASSIVTNYQKIQQTPIANANSWGLLFTPTAGSGGHIRRIPVFYPLAQLTANIITPAQFNTTLADMASYDNIDDYTRLFLRSAVTQTYNFNVSGGNSNALYYITANYTGNRQTRVKENDNRFVLSGRTTVKLSPRLSMELSTDYNEQRFNSSPVPAITAVNPYERFEDASGNPAFIVSSSISSVYNNLMMSQGMDDNLYYPLIDLNLVSDKTHSINNRITARFNYVLGGGFDLSFGGIYETSRSDVRHNAAEGSSEARQYINSYAVRNTDGTFKYNIPKGGFLRQTGTSTSAYTGRTQLNYNKKIAGVHFINAILGAEVRSLTTKGNTSSYFGYNDVTLLQQSVDYASIGSSAIIGTFRLGSPLQGQAAFESLFNQQYNEDRFLSGYSNLVYSYKNIYSLTGSIRIDQSNLFGTNPKYKYKPLWSLGAAWNVHRENFMRDISWINQFKLRAAYGFNGNVSRNSLPQVISRAVLNTFTSPTSQALRLVSYANSSLRWEQTRNINFGLDYTIFKNVNGSVDYYKKKSTDLLGNVQIDPTVGVSPSLINQATITNTGIEFGLRADWITTSKVNWNTGIVIARNTSKVLEVYQRADFSPQTLNTLGYVKGYPVGAMFSYRYAGLDTAGFPLIMNTKGTTYRTNVNTLGNATTALMASDTSGVSYYTGSSIPTINAGLSNRVDIGSFYVFCMINYYGGFKVRVPRPIPSSTRPLEGAGNYWKVKGDELTTDIQGLAAYASANSNNTNNNADKFVVNGDYITLGDLTVSYSLDKMNFIKKAGFSHFEVKCQASNIWTIGFNHENFSMTTGSYQKSYLTPTLTIGIFSNF